MEFLEKAAELNPKLKHTQFADYHGHGWIFRAVFKKDRKGNLLDPDDHIIPSDDPQKFAKAVHLKDVHLAKACSVWIATFLATCTATATSTANRARQQPSSALIATDNPATTDLGHLRQRRTDQPGSELYAVGPRFIREEKKLFQKSMLDPDARWEVPQTIDTIDPKSPHYNPKSAYAKTVRRDGKTWGDVPASDCKRTSPTTTRPSPARSAIPRGPPVVSAVICR